MKKINIKDCCGPSTASRSSGLLRGILFGILPHTFCILFVIFSVIGATSGVAFVQRFFIIPYLFQILIAVSFAFATLSAAFYLKRSSNLSMAGIKKKWKYLTIMFSTTVAVNLILFYIVLPGIGNIRSDKNNNIASVTSDIGQNNQEIQVIEMDQSGSGYSPSQFTVKANKPVKWIIHSESQSCSASIKASALGILKELNPGDNIIEFTPKEVGSVAFSCNMGMYRGIIKIEI